MNIRDIFRPKSYPALIILADYEAELLGQKGHGIVLRPPPPIPLRIHMPWTEAEMIAMRENRHLAKEIYNRIKGES